MDTLQKPHIFIVFFETHFFAFSSKMAFFTRGVLGSKKKKIIQQKEGTHLWKNKKPKKH